MERSNPEIELARQAAEGDAVALKVLLARSRDELCRRMAKRVPADLRSTLDIEDVIQEAHIEIFRRIGTFNPRGPESFHRWVALIAMSRLRDAIRRYRALKRGGGHQMVTPMQKHIEDSTLALLDTLAGPGRTPSKWLVRKEAIEAVHAALAELPEHQRAALWMVHLEGLSVKVAAANLGKTERAVQGLCRRGLKMLRQRLESTTTILSRTG